MQLSPQLTLAVLFSTYILKRLIMKKNITTVLASMFFCLATSSVSFADVSPYQEGIVDGKQVCWAYEGWNGYVEVPCNP